MVEPNQQKGSSSGNRSEAMLQAKMVTENPQILNIQQLNHDQGSGGNQKLPPRRFPTIGIIQKVPSTTNTSKTNITTMTMVSRLPLAQHSIY
jgi:hypothetical protein